VVIDVLPTGPAAGLVDKGEIIDTIDQRPMRHIADLDEALSRAEPDRALRMRVAPADTSPVRARTVLIRPTLPSVVR
jgi:hypothetical protein